MHTLFFHGLCKSLMRSNSTSTAFQGPFSRVEEAPTIEAISLGRAYGQDTSSQKINLTRTSYFNGEGKPNIFHAVRKAEIGVVCEDYLLREPMSALGNEVFNRMAAELMLGAAAAAVTENRVVSVQARTGIDAVCLAAQFVRQKLQCSVCLLPSVSLALYDVIVKCVGLQCQKYQYECNENSELNIYGLVADLMTAPEGAAVILDPSGHNTTGVVPNEVEWKLIAHILKCKKMLPIFHVEALGLLNGDIALDAWPVRYFAECGIDLLCAQSFVHNFALYNESVGNLLIVLSNGKQRQAITAQLEAMLYESHEQSSTAFASHIVAKILATDDLRNEWLNGLKATQQRLQQMRASLIRGLKAQQTPGNWNTLAKQRGLFMRIMLQDLQIDKLKAQHIYMPKSGCINVAALQPNNVDYVAQAIHNVIKSNEAKKSPDYEQQYVEALKQYMNM